MTLDEWDRLRACERVLLEHPDHPLAQRLRDEGVSAGAFDDEPAAQREGWGLVADPGSPRILELARDGASVTSGAAHVPDALTAAHGAPLGRRASAELGTLAYVMARLRSSDGCPWDREQTHESLRVHLIEETHEVLEAIDQGDIGAELEEELGDLLLQVAFHAQLAADDARFDLSGVARGITTKLLDRHPHVFGETEVEDADEVVRNWEAIKAKEKARDDPFEGMPASLSALLLAYKTQKRAVGLGFSPDPEEVRNELSRALDRPPDPEALGNALFWLVALARSAGIDPEGALRNATARFKTSL